MYQQHGLLKGGITDMKVKINSCGISDCPPSWHWTTKRDGFGDYDLWTAFRGQGMLSVQDDAESAQPIHEGISLLLAPNVGYRAWHEPSRPLLVINVHFDFLDDTGRVIHPRAFCARSIPDTRFFRELLTRTVSSFNSNREAEAEVFLMAALTEFDACESPHTTEHDDPWLHIIHEICTQIDTAKKPPSLSELASRYGYSERYVGKMFVKLQGISFSDYSRNSRISRAKALLRHTDAPISVIAEETGFYDACHFTKVFRQTVGVSPLAYRKQ